MSNTLKGLKRGENLGKYDIDLAPKQNPLWVDDKRRSVFTRILLHTAFVTHSRVGSSYIHRFLDASHQDSGGFGICRMVFVEDCVSLDVDSYLVHW